ncbi:MAG: methyltransferase [Dehalococcoidia bacterium]
MTTSTPPEAAPPAGGPPPLVREMQSMVNGLFRTQALYVAATLGIADLLADGPRDANALASATDAHAPSLDRVLRFLASLGVFTRDPEGRYALTELGELLRSDHPNSARRGAIFYGSPFIYDAWGHLLDSVRTGESAFEVAHGSNLFAYVATDPGALRVNSDYMTEMAGRRSPVAAQYRFPEAGLVVDVGGGAGRMLAGILEANLGLRGLLLDRPEVVQAAIATMAAAGLSDRCETVAGDFFEAVPEAGDLYILSNILHDWDDERCATILANCRRAMAPGAKLLVVDGILGDGPAAAFIISIDVQMLAVTGGKQRTEAEFRTLLDPAGFQVTQVTAPFFLEAVAV